MSPTSRSKNKVCLTGLEKDYQRNRRDASIICCDIRPLLLRSESCHIQDDKAIDSDGRAEDEDSVL